MYKCKYFKISELVCDHMLAKFSEETLWQILDENFKKTIDVVREILGKPMVCNSHKNGTHQRGVRCNLCDLVKNKKYCYQSAHVQGKAGDFTVQGMSAEEARNIIIANKEKLPCNIRLEHKQNGVPIFWLHIDVRDAGEKVYLFDT